MQSETGFPSSHQLKSYVAYKSRLKLAARAVLSADAGLLVPCLISATRRLVSAMYLALLLHGTLVVGVSQTLRRSTEGATHIRQGDRHVGRPTFLV